MKRFDLATIGRVVIALGLAATAWVGTVGATAGLDTSWEVGLHLAAQEHLRAGHDWVYTYGPGGYLAYPAWFGSFTGAMSVLVNFALRAAFAYLLVEVMRKRIPTLVAIVPAYFLMAAFPFESPELAVLVAALYVTPKVMRDERLSMRALAVLSVSGGVLATVKLNTAVIVAGVAVLFALRDRSMRALVTTAVGGLAGFVGAWLLLGQRLFDVVAYLRNGLEVIAGYTDASATEVPGLRWHYVAAAALTAALGLAMWRRHGKRGSTIFAIAVFGWIGYNTARHAFVRHDGHALAFFSMVCVIAIGVAAAQPRARAALGALTAIVALVVCTHIRPLDGLRHPLHNAHQAAADLKSSFLHPDRRVEAQRAIARAALDPNTKIVEGSDDRGVHIEPNDAVVAFAYGERWDPLPSFQELLTYTTGLDDLNVDKIADDPPQFVLLDRQAPAYDHRNAQFSAPRTRLALLCNYSSVAAAGQWSLLAVRSKSGCGAPTVLERRTVRPSETITVPQPRHGGIVVARFHVPEPLPRHKLLSVLWKPLNFPSIVVDGLRYRWLAAQAGGPFVMSTPPGAPFGSDASGTAIRTLAVSGFDGPSETVEFDEVPYASDVP